MNLYPTGHCFDDALDLLEDLVRKGATVEWLDAHCALVHGICHIPEGAGADADDVDGRPYAHAWLELDGLVLQGALPYRGAHPVRERIYYSTPLADFQARLRPARTWRYTLREVWMKNTEHGTYGPWEPELLQLLRPKRP